MNKLQLHQYQHRAAEFNQEVKTPYDAIDLGLGKTAIALKNIAETGRVTVVMAPLLVAKYTWPEEIRKWQPSLSYTVLHGKNKEARLKSKRDVYIINYAGLKWLFNRLKSTTGRITPMVLVLDETFFIKSHQTKRFKWLRQMIPLFPIMRIGMSATPSPEGLHELWSQYRILDKGKRLGTSYTKFREAFFNYNEYSRKTTIKSGKSKEVLNLIGDITFRLEGADYLELPEIVYNDILLDLPPKMKKLYRDMEKDFFIELEDMDIEAFSAAARNNKLRQMLQGGIIVDEKGAYKRLHYEKYEMFKEIIDGLPGKQVLCPIHFRFEYNMICEVFGKPLPKITGASSDKEKMHNIEEWNRGNVGILLCHPQSVGYGLNLQKQGHNIIWVAPTWSCRDFLQLNGRLARQGQIEKQVVVNSTLFRHTLDTRIAETTRIKGNNQQDLLNAIKQYGKERGYY